MEFMIWFVLILSAFMFVLKRLNDWSYAVKLGKRWAELPPSNMGWPLLGATLSYLKSFTSGQPENLLRNFSIRYVEADMYKTHILGTPIVIVCTPEICRQVFTNEDIFVPSAPGNANILSGRKVLMKVSKAEHKRLRQLTTTPISGHVSLEMYINHIEDTVVGGLEEWASMQRPIELLTEIKKLMFTVIWNIFMGSTSVESSMGVMEGLLSEVAVRFISFPINFPGFRLPKSL